MDRQRIDKWLWHARVVRTRSAAAALVAAGHVRVNGVRVKAASHPVRLDDALTVALDGAVRVLKVTGFADRRGDALMAAGLREDLVPRAPKTPAEPSPAARTSGSGRPTKRERRDTDRLGG